MTTEAGRWSEPSSTDAAFVALVGNPNVGKSALFNLLTGKYAVVSNYPGTTVEVATGAMHLKNGPVMVVDTPGANSLIPKSEDERVTRDILLQKSIRAVIQVADAKNLRRALTLTTQLAEMELPVVLALNMWDEALERGICIDVKSLEQVLGIPVVCTVATQRRGLRDLLASLERVRAPRVQVKYPRRIEEAVERIASCFATDAAGSRALALMALADEGTLSKPPWMITPQNGAKRGEMYADSEGVLVQNKPVRLGRHRHRWGRIGGGCPWSHEVAEEIARIRQAAQREFAEPLSYVISRARAAFVDELTDKVLTRSQPPVWLGSWRQASVLWAALPVVFFFIGCKLADLALWLVGARLNLGARAQWMTLGVGGAVSAVYMRHLLRGVKTHRSLSHQLGNLAMHPVLAFPILLMVLWLLYKIVGQFGAGLCVDFLQNTIFRGYLLPAAESVAGKIVSSKGLLYQMFFSQEAGLISVGLTYSIAIVGPIVTFFFLAFGLLEDSGYLPRLAVMLDRVFKKIGLTGKAALPMVLGLGCDTMATLTTRILDTRKQRTIAIFLLALAVPCSAQLGVISAVLGRVSGLAFAIYVGVIVMQMLLVGYLAARVIPGERPDFMIEIPPFRLPGIRNIVLKTFYRLHMFLREAVPLFLLGTFILFVLTRLGILSLLESAASPIVVGVLELPKETTAGFILGFLRRDYGVISIFSALDRVEHGHIPPADLLVALTVMTLFVPCLANFFVMIKEQGLKRAALMVAFIFPYAFLVGGVMRQALRWVTL